MRLLLLALNFVIFPIFSSAFSTPSVNGDNYFGCDLNFEKTNICGMLRWKNPPVPYEFSEFILDLYENETKQNRTLKVSNLKIKLWMPDMGHGSSPVTLNKITTPQGPYFHVTKVFFSMGGKWEVRIHLLDSEGQELDRKYYELDL